jgi:hypothetical protein
LHAQADSWQTLICGHCPEAPLVSCAIAATTALPFHTFAHQASHPTIPTCFTWKHATPINLFPHTNHTHTPQGPHLLHLEARLNVQQVGLGARVQQEGVGAEAEGAVASVLAPALVLWWLPSSSRGMPCAIVNITTPLWIVQEAGCCAWLTASVLVSHMGVIWRRSLAAAGTTRRCSAVQAAKDVARVLHCGGGSRATLARCLG